MHPEGSSWQPLLAHRTETSRAAALTAVDVCVVCGHQDARSTGRQRITCPECGSTAWQTRPAGRQETGRCARTPRCALRLLPGRSCRLAL